MTLLRKTTQFVLPVEKPETGVNQYDIYPAHDLVLLGEMGIVLSVSRGET